MTSVLLFSRSKSLTREVGIFFKPTQTSHLSIVATVEARLTRPRSRLGFKTHSVLPTDDRRGTVHTLMRRAEVMHSLVY